MRLTLVHPAVGRRPGVDYMRTWQMEPLPIAIVKGGAKGSSLSDEDNQVSILRRHLVKS